MITKEEALANGLQYCDECEMAVVSLEIHNDFWHKGEE